MAQTASVTVKIVNRGKFALPEYKTPGSAGCDLYANLDNPLEIKPMQRVLIPTGLFMELPLGYEAQVRARSGLALKHGIGVLNSPGTIDADYRGEIQIILINLSTETYTLHPGERIAQLIVAAVCKAEWIETETLNLTERGEGGFGSTGIKTS